MDDKPIPLRSYWMDSVPETGYPALTGDGSYDVAVVGGGIVGLTTAYFLKKSGRSVAVLESRRIASQVTGGTTAKVTSLHGLIYAYLIKNFGEERARMYAESNQAAIGQIEALIGELGIDCDFERKSAFTVTESGERRPEVEAEVRAAERLGIPASFAASSPLPFPITAGVEFRGQAQFHPRKYLLPVAQAVDGGGCRVFETTRVLDVEDDSPCVVITDKGRVKAKDVVVATNLPILDRGLFFSKAFPRRHLVLGIRVPPEQVPDGMFLGISPSYSVRAVRTESGPLLFVLGSSFKTGHADTREKFDELYRFVQRRFKVESVEYRWGNQDYDSIDRVPFIGKLTPFTNHIFTATGFNAWGMTGSMVAARMIRDRIDGTRNPLEELYDATRFNPKTSAMTFLTENLHVGKEFLGDQLSPAERKSAAGLAPGEGGIFSIDGRKTAVSRDREGVLHPVSAHCSHLGCIVRWNGGEGSWDCPCHGSRFDINGRVLGGPAIRDLEPRKAGKEKEEAA